MDTIEFDFGDSEDAKLRVQRLHTSFNPKWEPDEPKETKPIWRYRSFEQLCELLSSESLWFSHVSGFDDPYEAVFSGDSKHEIALLDAFTNDGRPFTGGGMTKGRQHAISYASCWHVNDDESAALWNQYGGEQNAVAIKSSPEYLKEALDTTGHYMMYGEVEYVNLKEKPIPNDPEYPVFFKRDDFEYEDEYRAVLLDYSRLATLMANWPDIVEKYEEFVGDASQLSVVDLMKPGYSLKINLDVLIDAIYVDPTASRRFYKAVKSVVSKYTDCDVVESELFDDPVEQ